MPDKEITPAAIEVLASLEYRENRAHITAGQLAPDLYREVNEILKRLGGDWRGGRTKAHVFPSDPAPLVRAALEAGTLPPRNPTAYFPSPKPVVELVMAWAEPDRLLPNDLILEPSAGTGALADALREAGCGAQLRLVEADPINARVLREKGYEVCEGDFLAYQPGERFGLVVMNPPFSLTGDREAYITHILHAWTLLKPGGRLVAVAPSGYLNRSNSRKVTEFREFVFAHGSYERLPDGAFRDSGTMVGTTVISLDRQTRAEEAAFAAPHEGYRNYFCCALDVAARSSRDFYAASQALYARIRAGRPDTLSSPEIHVEVRRLYEQVAREVREQTGFLRLGVEDWAWLAEEFLADYRAWASEQDAAANLSLETAA